MKEITEKEFKSIVPQDVIDDMLEDSEEEETDLPRNGKTMKYIIVDHAKMKEYAILFPEDVSHSQIVKCLDPNQKAISAGFVFIYESIDGQKYEIQDNPSLSTDLPFDKIRDEITISRTLTPGIWDYIPMCTERV